MSRKGAILDVDGTLTRGFYIKKFPKALYESGEFSSKALSHMEGVFIKYKTRKISYEEAVPIAVDLFARGVEGKKQENVAYVGKKYIEEHPDDLFPFTNILFELFRERDYVTLLVSGSPRDIIYPFSEKIGADEVAATSFEVDSQGIFTGEVERNCGLSEVKEEILKEFLLKYDIDSNKTSGWGDTKQDESLLRSSRYPVAIKPNNGLRKIAEREGWLICDDDETVISKVRDYIPI